MKKSHYVFALIFLAGTTLYAQRDSEQQGSVRALGGSSSPRASARVLGQSPNSLLPSTLCRRNIQRFTELRTLT